MGKRWTSCAPGSRGIVFVIVSHDATSVEAKEYPEASSPGIRHRDRDVPALRRPPSCDCQHRGAHNDRADSRAPRPGRTARRFGVSEPCAAPGRVVVLTALHCRAAAPGTGGSWLAAGCASISRWNAKIRPTNHARSRRLGADVGARRTAPPGSTAPRQLTYGPLYALSAERSLEALSLDREDAGDARRVLRVS